MDEKPNRRSSRIPLQSKEVVLHDAKCGVISGKTLDEAFGGLGILVDQAPDIELGQEADVFYNGMRMTAVVRHIRNSENGRVRVGMAWKGAILSKKARNAMLLRRDRGLESDDLVYERFIRSIPSAVHTMWSLYEARNWLALAESAERLGKHARSADVEDLTPYVDRLNRYVSADETFETVGKALHELIETAIDVCSSLDW